MTKEEAITILMKGWSGSIREFGPILKACGYNKMLNEYYSNSTIINIDENGFLSVHPREKVQNNYAWTDYRQENNIECLKISPLRRGDTDTYIWIFIMDEKLFSSIITIVYGQQACRGRDYENIYDILNEGQIKISRATKVNKLITYNKCLSDENELSSLLLTKYPYTYRFMIEHSSEKAVAALLMCPFIEILYKANFSFITSIVMHWLNDKTFVLTSGRTFYYNSCVNQADINIFNRLCQNGTDSKTIFKCPRYLYNLLKDENDLNKWDIFRRMDKMGKIDQDTLKTVYEENYSARDLTMIDSILTQKYQNKNIFSWNTLVNYLRRIDMYEAIGTYDGLQLLTDYLGSCRILNMEPKIDGDSLKREHDVAARLCIQKRDDMCDAGIRKYEAELRTLSYHTDKFLIRPIQSQDDLCQEVTQQHNCVAGYAERIAKQKSIIVVIRKQDQPKRSLVTLELSPDKATIRQKLLAYNQQIRDKDISDFITEWFDNIVKPQQLKEA